MALNDDLREQTAALRSILRRAAALGLGCARGTGLPAPRCGPFSYQQLDHAADELATQLNQAEQDLAIARTNAAYLRTERDDARHALAVVADMLRGGDVDGVLTHLDQVLADHADRLGGGT